LALEQAAAYVSVRKIDFKKYLEMYRARRKDVLSQTKPIAGGATETVATIWRANFDDVEAESPAAADILRISAFFAPDDIPLELIEKGATEISESVAAAMRTALTVNDVLEPLMRYSLIHLNEANATYGVHRLLQAIMQDAMTEPERRNWAEKAVKAVDGAFPDVSDFYQWGACERFLPHGTHLAGVMDEFGLETAEAATVLNDCGHFLKERARYGAALPLLKRALAIREKALGSEHPDTAGSLNNLAELYSEQGEYGKAEPLYERALAITEKALGVEHPDMAASLNNLAALYYARGEYGKALPLFERALAIWEKALGGEHPLTATSLNNLAELYQAQREYAKALPLYERALAIWEEALGADHPETARALNNLALLYYVQGNYAKPEPLCVRALEIFEKALGPEHPLTKKCAGLLSRIRHGLDAQGVGAHVVEPTT
jgi:tetratricopeptide (TPR) repeat protein